MAILANQTIVGSVGRVYELRTVGKDNTEVVDFTVAVTPRKKVNDEWTDGTTYWSTITAWGRLAKNISESFRPGDRVVVIGRTEMKDGYTNKENVEVPARPIIVADFAGLEVSYNAAHSDKVAKSEGGGYNRDNGNSSNARRDDAPAAKSAPVDTADDDLDLDDADFTPF